MRNQQFTFEGKTKTVLFVLMAVGVLSAAWILLGNGDYKDYNTTRFWTNFLLNSVLFTGVGFLAVFYYSARITAYAGWDSDFKRVMEAVMSFLPVGLVLMLIIAAGNYFGFHHLYHWVDDNAVKADEILQWKSGFLNKGVYLIATVVILLMWIFFARKFRSLSVQEDNRADGEFSVHRTMRKYAAIFLPLGGFSSAAIIWLWVMSIDAHWYSTLFAWYVTASWLVSFFAIVILMLVYLKSKGYYQLVTAEHFHDLGKYLFGFSIFWTYLWFSQYMLIWYGNVGEETIYFYERMRHYPVLFYGNLVLNFVLPFFLLMFNTSKRKLGLIAFVAALVLFGHWFDIFQMVKPGALLTAREHAEHHASAANGHEAHGADVKHADNHATTGHATAEAEHGHTATGHEEVADVHGVNGFIVGFDVPGLQDVGMFVGFGALFLLVVFSALSKANLYAANDPYFEESTHHQVMQLEDEHHH
jgi:hypothetical protein